MCGRFTGLTFEEVEAVAKAVEQRLVPSALALPDERRTCSFPGSSIPLIAPDADGSLAVQRATWGFEPEWSKRLVFNTRIESALEGAALWREAVDAGRCIIPVASFFEPHASETVPSPRTGRPMKRPYEFADPSGAPLLLAGLQAGDRCSIVTCEPNRWVAPVHNRMPLVMRFHEVSTWLSSDWPSLADRGAVELSVAPEQLQPPAQERVGNKPSDQLSLF